MIFYTLKGPGHKLEIHDNKIVLSKRAWLNFFPFKEVPPEWNLNSLSYFAVTHPKFFLWGKIEWRTFSGSSGSFRFSTNAQMVQKIELYLQKKTIKNHQLLSGLEVKIQSERKAKKSDKAA